VNARRATLSIALGGGLLLRLAALPLPGAGDVDPWKVWSYNAVTDGVTALYGTGSPPSQADFRFHDKVAPVNYPPLALYELGAVGRLYSLATGGQFPDTVALTVVIKLLPVIFEVGLAAVLFGSLRRTADEDRARWGVLSYWLNPAAIVCASVGGYLDTLPALPALGAIVAASAGWPAAAGALTASAALTKPQGALVVPAVLLAVWNVGSGERAARLKRLAAAVAGGLIVSAILLAPVVRAGVWPNMVFMLKTMGDDRNLSMSGYNLWWLAGHAMTVGYASIRGASVSAALTAPVAYVSFDRAAAHGLPHLRAVGTLLAAASIGWGVWIGRKSADLPLVAAVAAFSVCSYALLATRVHENHAFLAVPLLAMAAAGRQRFTRALWAVSAWFTLNVVFYGITDDGRFVVSRSFTVIDATLLVALLGCVSLAWFARVLYAECRIRQA
jgi:hypothetical protein